MCLQNGHAEYISNNSDYKIKRPFLSDIFLIKIVLRVILKHYLQVLKIDFPKVPIYVVEAVFTPVWNVTNEPTVR